MHTIMHVGAKPLTMQMGFHLPVQDWAACCILAGVSLQLNHCASIRHGNEGAL